MKQDTSIKAETEAPTPDIAPTTQIQIKDSQAITNGFAIASMVVGIVAFLSGWIAFWGLFVGAGAVVLGIIALKQPTGRSLAIIGIITGGLAALTGLLFTVLTIIGIITSGVYIDEGQNHIHQETPMNQGQFIQP